jgi:Transcriptional regulatory protein, C terminal
VRTISWPSNFRFPSCRHASGGCCAAAIFRLLLCSASTTSNLDRVERRVERGGRRIELTSKEFGLLEYLMLNAGRRVTRAMIVEHVWNLPSIPVAILLMCTSTTKTFAYSSVICSTKSGHNRLWRSSSAWRRHSGGIDAGNFYAGQRRSHRRPHRRCRSRR